MKAFFVTTLSATVLLIQSCAVGTTLVDSREVTVTHEHRVQLPASLYSPGATNNPMFEKKGDFTLAVDFTNSGKDTNDDPNPNGNTMLITEGITHQNITTTHTFSIQGGYAPTDDIGIIGSITAGKTREQYRAYIESWNLTQDIYNYEYWAGIPLDWDTWLEGSWYSTGSLQTINDYQKVSKNLTRSYRYFDGEVAAGKYTWKNKLKSGLYGGLGFARNTAEGHLQRGNTEAAYARHDANFFKVFVLPSAAFRVGWIEAGLSLKSSLLLYRLQSTTSGNNQYAAESDNAFFIEPAMFLHFGPRAFKIKLEHKWLKNLGDTSLPYNPRFTSIGVMTTLNRAMFR